MLMIYKVGFEFKYIEVNNVTNMIDYKKIKKYEDSIKRLKERIINTSDLNQRELFKVKIIILMNKIKVVKIEGRF